MKVPLAPHPPFWIGPVAPRLVLCLSCLDPTHTGTDKIRYTTGTPGSTRSSCGDPSVTPSRSESPKKPHVLPKPQFRPLLVLHFTNVPGSPEPGSVGGTRPRPVSGLWGPDTFVLRGPGSVRTHSPCMTDRPYQGLWASVPPRPPRPPGLLPTQVLANRRLTDEQTKHRHSREGP